MWHTLDHTADVALEVEATSWSELLAEAARAFGEWATGGRLPAEPHATERVITVRGTDRIETWVHYWRELLRLWTVEGFMPVHARVADADGLAVSARVGCVSAGALDPAHCADVKAVTWHDARVEQLDGRWIGRIVLDL
jgi:SHS2 domain-containing protein